MVRDAPLCGAPHHEGEAPIKWASAHGGGGDTVPAPGTAATCRSPARIRTGGGGRTGDTSHEPIADCYANAAGRRALARHHVFSSAGGGIAHRIYRADDGPVRPGRQGHERRLPDVSG